MWQDELPQGFLHTHTHVPGEAINKEIMAKLFSQRLCVSLTLFKCANHFFHYGTREKGGVGMYRLTQNGRMQHRNHYVSCHTLFYYVL